MSLPPSTTDVTLKRLTLDLDVNLHRALKIRAAELGVTMADLLRLLLERSLSDRSTIDDWAKQAKAPSGKRDNSVRRGR